MPPMGQPLPTDWTNGAGTIVSGGTISIPANPRRQWLHVQNQGSTAIDVNIGAVNSGGTSGINGTIVLNPGTANADNTLDMSATNYVPAGPVTVTGTAGTPVAVLEG